MCSSKREEENITIHICQRDIKFDSRHTYEAILKLGEKAKCRVSCVACRMLKVGLLGLFCCGVDDTSTSSAEKKKAFVHTEPLHRIGVIKFQYAIGNR